MVDATILTKVTYLTRWNTGPRSWWTYRKGQKARMACQRCSLPKEMANTAISSVRGLVRLGSAELM